MSAKGIAESSPKDTQSMSEANNHLAVSLFKLLARDGGNVFISPFSVSTAMAMLFCGSERQTSAEMRSALGYDAAEIKDASVRSSFRQILEEMGACPSIAWNTEFVKNEKFRN